MTVNTQNLNVDAQANPENSKNASEGFSAEARKELSQNMSDHKNKVDQLYVDKKIVELRAFKEKAKEVIEELEALQREHCGGEQAA